MAYFMYFVLFIAAISDDPISICWFECFKYVFYWFEIQILILEQP
jgi:hypothetical protein